jgi:CheY-like chemotaxis protein
MTTKCILQVEDDEADVFMLQTVFKRAGITSPLHVVSDGQMAIDYLSGAGSFADRERHPLPCLVLLDLKMPKVNGLEVLAWIRQQPHLKKLVVVLFSSSAFPEDVARGYELGANSFIQKPSDMAHTLEIAQLLKGWWLGYNHYAPIDTAPKLPSEAATPVISAACLTSQTPPGAQPSASPPPPS